MRNISILLAVSYAIVRAGMRRILESESDMTVVGEAEDGAQAVACAMRLQPSVMVLDLASHQRRSIEITRSVRVGNPGTRILALSDRSAQTRMAGDVDACIGGYILRDYSAGEIASVIRRVHAGNDPGPGAYGDQRQRILAQRDGGACDRSPGKLVELLTPREVEVLRLIAEGNANKQTAIKLAISRKTVEKHRDNLMRKLDIHNTAGLTRYAIGSGIAELQLQVSS